MTTLDDFGGGLDADRDASAERCDDCGQLRTLHLWRDRSLCRRCLSRKRREVSG